MELKPLSEIADLTVKELLIVPYGIETVSGSESQLIIFLLIVPYGIETVIISQTYLPKQLLIVPYGIETMVDPYTKADQAFF